MTTRGEYQGSIKPGEARNTVTDGAEARKRRAHFLTILAETEDVDAALEKAKRTKRWLKHHRDFDPEFREAVDRFTRRPGQVVGPLGSFEEFRGHYFGERGRTFPHMRPWIHAFENPDVRWCIIIGPPEHARTTVMTVQRYAYLAAQEAYETSLQDKGLEWPLRAAVISASSTLAERMGWQLNQYLTDPFFSGELIKDYGPFRRLGREARWTAKQAYLRWRGAEEKDPSFQFAGWGEGLQSARLSDATLDDADDPLYGPSERVKLLRYIDQIVIPRLGTKGRLWYLCNRVDELDVAQELIERAEDGTWHAIVQSAINPDGSALWPEHIPIEHLETQRKQLRNERMFSLIYLSSPTPGDHGAFPRSLVEQSLDTSRCIGDVPAGTKIVATLDPAPVGGAGVLAVAYDPSSDKRYLVDLEWGTERHTSGLKTWIKDYLALYRPESFGIESQAMNQLFTADADLRRLIADYDCRQVDLPTGRNKRDPQYGVGAMRDLFGPPHATKYSFPAGDVYSRRKSDQLINQLASYHPDTKQPVDLVMCLWFAERCIEAGFRKRSRSRTGKFMDRLVAGNPWMGRKVDTRIA